MLETSPIDCPYCGENFEIGIDCSAGSQSYIEDCPVCCRPIELKTEIDISANLVSIAVHRDDD